MENNPEEPHVLIARNNETGQIGAVTGQNADGSPKTADMKTASITDLVQFGKGQNSLEAFMSNFMREAKNPSIFGLFRVKAENFETEGRALGALLENPEQNKEMLAGYAVKAEAPHKRLTRIDPDAVDWPRIEQEFGVTRQSLEEHRQLTDMLYNRKSPGLVTITTEIDGVKTEMQARLQFIHNADGSLSVSPHIRKEEPQLDKPYMGHTFTQEEKDALLQTGSIPSQIELTDPVTGNKVMSVVQLDRLTNELQSIPFSQIYIKDKICNLELGMKEIMTLKNGGTIPGREITAKDGRQFMADLQYSIDRRELALINMKPIRQRQEVSQSPSGDMDTKGRKYSFTDAEGNPKRLKQWYRIPMDTQKQNDYLSGKKVEVGVVSAEGKDYMVFLQFNKERKYPESSFGILENGKVVGFAEASKVQAAVNLKGKTNEATKNIREPLDIGQTGPKNSRQKATQQTDAVQNSRQKRTAKAQRV